MNISEENTRDLEELRCLLYKTAAGKSFTDPEVIEVSQKLNEEINRYMYRQRKQRKRLTAGDDA
jgi:hypothetical protein